MTGEEDEGFQDDWLSNLYGRGHRASTGSTMSSHSTGKRRRRGKGGRRRERKGGRRGGGRGNSIKLTNCNFFKDNLFQHFIFYYRDQLHMEQSQ